MLKPERGRAPLPGGGRHPAPLARAGGARDGARAGGAGHLPEPHRPREPGPRRLPPDRPGRDRAGRRAGVHAVPHPGRATHPGGRHALRRRAADAGGGPRADEPAQADAARRAVAGARAAGGGADLQRAARRERLRRGAAAGRAERAQGAPARPPRLRPRDRQRGDDRGPARSCSPRRRSARPTSASERRAGPPRPGARARLRPVLAPGAAISSADVRRLPSPRAAPGVPGRLPGRAPHPARRGAVRDDLRRARARGGPPGAHGAGHVVGGLRRLRPVHRGAAHPRAGRRPRSWS